MVISRKRARRNRYGACSLLPVGVDVHTVAQSDERMTHQSHATTLSYSAMMS